MRLAYRAVVAARLAEQGGPALSRRGAVVQVDRVSPGGQPAGPTHADLPRTNGLHPFARMGKLRENLTRAGNDAYGCAAKKCRCLRLAALAQHRSAIIVDGGGRAIQHRGAALLGPAATSPSPNADLPSAPKSLSAALSMALIGRNETLSRIQRCLKLA